VTPTGPAAWRWWTHWVAIPVSDVQRSFGQPLCRPLAVVKPSLSPWTRLGARGRRWHGGRKAAGFAPVGGGVPAVGRQSCFLSAKESAKDVGERREWGGATTPDGPRIRARRASPIHSPTAQHSGRVAGTAPHLSGIGGGRSRRQAGVRRRERCGASPYRGGEERPRQHRRSDAQSWAFTGRGTAERTTRSTSR